MFMSSFKKKNKTILGCKLNVKLVCLNVCPRGSPCGYMCRVLVGCLTRVGLDDFSRSTNTVVGEENKCQ